MQREKRSVRRRVASRWAPASSTRRRQGRDRVHGDESSRRGPGPTLAPSVLGDHDDRLARRAGEQRLSSDPPPSPRPQRSVIAVVGDVCCRTASGAGGRGLGQRQAGQVRVAQVLPAVPVHGAQHAPATAREGHRTHAWCGPDELPTCRRAQFLWRWSHQGVEFVEHLVHSTRKRPCHLSTSPLTSSRRRRSSGATCPRVPRRHLRRSLSTRASVPPTGPVDSSQPAPNSRAYEAAPPTRPRASALARNRTARNHEPPAPQFAQVCAASPMPACASAGPCG